MAVSRKSNGDVRNGPSSGDVYSALEKRECSGQSVDNANRSSRRLVTIAPATSASDMT